jgi:hypothetical protein
MLMDFFHWCRPTEDLEAARLRDQPVVSEPRRSEAGTEEKEGTEENGETQQVKQEVVVETAGAPVVGKEDGKAAGEEEGEGEEGEGEVIDASLEEMMKVISEEEEERRRELDEVRRNK